MINNKNLVLKKSPYEKKEKKKNDPWKWKKEENPSEFSPYLWFVTKAVSW
jgi:hypothetical protein